MGLTSGADVSQLKPENSHQMLSNGADAYVAASQRYIGNERGVLGLEFKLSQMSV
jgi:hypothetical protein